MSLNTTPTGERVQIGIFGRVNAGKSSLLNALTGQDMAVVSDTPGTTTDPVKKAMELLPLGPVTIYDTPGLGDAGGIGHLRMKKTEEILRRIDIGLVVIDGAMHSSGGTDCMEEKKLLEGFNRRGIPCLVIINKTDQLDTSVLPELLRRLSTNLSLKNEQIAEFSATASSEQERKSLRERIAKLFQSKETPRHLVADLIDPGDMVVLVVPIDESAPKGRLILPQQQVIRDILEKRAAAVVIQPAQIEETLASLQEPPRLVITDSQAFGEVAERLPAQQPLTSFSILMARYKGDLFRQAAGAKAIDGLKDGATLLISEGCTHHRQCGDIGTVKLPKWIKEHTGKQFHYEFTSGGEFPNNLSNYDLIIHCGGCTLPPQEMAYRMAAAKAAGVAMTNYGTLIAYIHGILDRAMQPLLDINSKEQPKL